jgi:hypothetical protein
MVLIFLDDIDGNALELAVRSQMVPFLGTFLNNSNHVSVPIDKFFKTVAPTNSSVFLTIRTTSEHVYLISQDSAHKILLWW